MLVDNRNPPALRPPLSQIMEETSVAGIYAIDMGGVLFPDHPNLETPPFDEIVELVSRIGQTWGVNNGYIAANVSFKENFFKDGELLSKNDIHEKTGILNDSNHFLKCQGPEDKGPKIEPIVSGLRKKNYKVMSLIIDNRFRVARSVSSDTHKFVLNGKDSLEHGIAEWLSEIHPRLYRINGTIEECAKEIAARFVQIHLGFVKLAANGRITRHRSRLLPGLYEDEVKRVLNIFEFSESSLPQDLLKL